MAWLIQLFATRIWFFWWFQVCVAYAWIVLHTIVTIHEEMSLQLGVILSAETGDYTRQENMF